MLLKYLNKAKNTLKVIDENVSRLENSTFNLNIALICSDFLKNDRNLFVVLPTLSEATKYYDALEEELEDGVVLFYPVDEIFLASLAIASNDFKYERVNTLINLSDNKKHIIVTNINGVLRKNITKEVYDKTVIHLELNKEYDIKEIRDKLISLGYQKVSVTRNVGSFSFRGSIIDYYPIGSDNPIRLDFFDDVLDQIKYYDPNTQKSFESLDRVDIVPFEELFFNDVDKNELINYIKDKKSGCSLEEQDILDNVIVNLETNNNLDQLYYFASFYYETSSILDYVSSEKIYLINEAKCNSIYSNLLEKNQDYYQEIGSQILVNYPLYLDKDEVLNDKNITYIDTFEHGNNSYDIKSEEIPPFYGNLELIARELGSKIHHNYVIVAVEKKEVITRLKQYFLEVMLPYKTVSDLDEADIHVVNFIEEDIKAIYLPKDALYIVDLMTLFPYKREKRKIKYKSTFNEGNVIKDYQELNVGDYIVHINHGIGLYEGIKTIELSKRKRDYLSIRYAKDERLYIPIEQLSLIKRYVGREGVVPKLTVLGSNSWERTKEKTRQKIEELSDKLIKIYSEREKAIGHTFALDSDDQKQFESEFPYEETKDQLETIKAVKRDMESPKVMDRLICGDVGYGKTEVALRAAFKAVYDGMQVCYLAPTTILTRQHYYTFKDRMGKYGINVCLLNRFTSTKETKKILEGLKKGSVDILIGTHRVLSDDVKFKNLGLLITDEEQRFGVMHKEKIKEMKINVDSIMLTATPIPRTLQMSLVGIKELSLIETPPKNRYPVQTYVIQRNNTVIKEAIERELARGGQVFYLYNFVEDIEDVCQDVSKIVPEARICYAHGKMNKNELENIITKFIDKEYDILVSTTIIETGIDIPEANTLIVHDADRLGLSQLYQIRGRVGRSDRIAYAYLMFEPRKILTDNAVKRLEAIKEYQELGSGFKIAMRDLTIRGAGDLLGQEQSGFIDSVGLDTYMEILNETIEAKEHKEVEHKKIIGTLKASQVLADRFIPERYLLDESLKIEIHNKINKIRTQVDVDDLLTEFTDRFGVVEDSLKAYMYEKLFINLCNTAGVEKIDIKQNLLSLTLTREKSQSIDGEYIFMKAYEISDDFNLMYKDYRINIFLKLARYENGLWLIPACSLLSIISEK